MILIMQDDKIFQIVLFQRIFIPPTEGFKFEPPTSLEFQFSVILSFKKIVLLKPPCHLKFPFTFLGVGLDIFWNCT